MNFKTGATGDRGGLRGTVGDDRDGKCETFPVGDGGALVLSSGL